MKHKGIKIVAGAVVAALCLGFGEKDTNNSDLQLSKVAGKQLVALKQLDEKKLRAAQAAGDVEFAKYIAENSTPLLRKTKSKRRLKKMVVEENKYIASYLAASKEELARIDALPENVFAGAYGVIQNNCLRCHSVAGEGKKKRAPDLGGVAKEHDAKWLKTKLIDPEATEPDSDMKSFKSLPDEQLDAIVTYLMTLK